MKDERLKQLIWFTGGAICGLAMLSISHASVPDLPGNVTDDSAIYQNLSEIQLSKDKTPTFDGDISRLARMETRYQDQLPGSSGRYNLRRRAKRVSSASWNDIPTPSR